MRKLPNLYYFVNPYYWPAWLGIGCLWLSIHLPVAWKYWLGKRLGRLVYGLSPKLKHITQTNIRLCFPSMTTQQQYTLIKKNSESLGLGLIESAMAWWLPARVLTNAYTLTGQIYLEQALQQGKGIILVGPHFISLEMIGRLLGAHHAFAVVYRPHKKPFISFLHQFFRRKHYLNYIARDNVRDLVRSLKKNMPIWLAYDIDAGKQSSVFAPFFGIPSASLTSISRLAALTGAAVIPISFYRREHGFHYDIHLQPPLPNFPSHDLVADAIQLNAVLEQAIRRHPEHYIWQYKRFKTRPAGQDRFY